jgi:ABC-type multidrug transport system ATPase subunit
LLDEPLDDVDPASLTTICDAISQLGRAGKTVIVSTSQPDRLVTVTNTMFVFAEQQILEVPSGGTDDLTSASDQRFFK